MNSVVYLIFLISVLISKNLSACDEVLRNIQSQLSSDFKVRIMSTGTNSYAVIEDFKLFASTPHGKHIDSIMGKYGVRAGDGWRLNKRCVPLVLTSEILEVKSCKLNTGPRISEVGTRVEITPTLSVDKKILNIEFSLYENGRRVLERDKLEKIKWNINLNNYGTGNVVSVPYIEGQPVDIYATYKTLARNRILFTGQTARTDEHQYEQVDIVLASEEGSVALIPVLISKAGKNLIPFYIANGKAFHWSINEKLDCTVNNKPIAKCILKNGNKIPHMFHVDLKIDGRDGIISKDISINSENAELVVSAGVGAFGVINLSSKIKLSNGLSVEVAGETTYCLDINCNEKIPSNIPVDQLPKEFFVYFIPDGISEPENHLVAKVSSGEILKNASSDLEIKTKTAMNDDGSLVCKSTIVYKGREIDSEKPSNEEEVEIINNFNKIATPEFPVTCEKLSCQSLEKNPYGKITVQTFLKDKIAFGTCNFAEPDWSSAKVVMKSGTSESGAFCRAQIIVNTVDKGDPLEFKTLPKWLGGYQWNTKDGVVCNGLYCETPFEHISADIEVDIKGRKIASVCEVEESKKEEEKKPVKLKFDPYAGGKAVQMPPPIRIPADTGFYVLPGMQ